MPYMNDLEQQRSNMPVAPHGIPVDGALAALRRCLSALGKRADGATWAREYLETSAAVECLALAIEQAQVAERVPSPELVEALYQLRRQALDGVAPDRARDLRDRFRAVERIVHDPEHARVTMTPIDRLTVIAGLVMTLPGPRPELWCALPVDLVATLPGAEVEARPRDGEPGKVLHVARATVAGLRVVALETRDARPEDGGEVSP